MAEKSGVPPAAEMVESTAFLKAARLVCGWAEKKGFRRVGWWDDFSAERWADLSAAELDERSAESSAAC